MTRPLLLTVRFARRSRQEQHLLLSAAILVTTAHLLVRQPGLQPARHRLGQLAALLGARATSVEQLAWVVRTISQNLPGHHSCLILALCCQALADQAGLAAELRLGASRTDDRIQFHAWVEHAGRVICGGEHGDFVALA